MPRALHLLFATCAVWLPLAGAASAEEVTASSTYIPGYKGSSFDQLHVTVTAAAGERNDVLVTRAGDVIRVEDAGAPLTAGEGCMAAAGGVECPLGHTLEPAVGVRAGDGDDTVTVAGGVEAGIAGGEGDDRLQSGDEGGSLSGGPGDDLLQGGSGDDWLDGGPGRDVLRGGGRRDVASYGSRTAGIRAQIGADGNGEPGEDDTIAADVEDLYGGAGDDVLMGSDGENELDGGAGNDLLEGGGSRDVLRGGDWSVPEASDHEADVLHGGGGPDVINVRAGETGYGDAGDDAIMVWFGGTASGGPGGDLITTFGAGGILHVDDDDEPDVVDCDRSGFAGLVTLGARDDSFGCGLHVVRTPPGTATAEVRAPMSDFSVRAWPTRTGADVLCPDDAGPRCRARVTLRTGSTVLARRTVTVRPGEERRVWLTLPRAAQRRLRRDGVLPVAFTVTMRDLTGVVRARFAAGCVQGGDDPVAHC